MKKAGSLSLAVGAVAIGTMALAAPAMATGPTLKAAPNKNLVNNQKVTLKYAGFTPGATLYVVQCSTKAVTASNAAQLCNVAGLVKATVPATGKGSVTFTVKTGQIGSSASSQCVPKSTCYLGAATLSPSANASAAIKFK